MNSSKKGLSLSTIIVSVVIVALVLNSGFLVVMSFRENRSIVIDQSAQKAMTIARNIAPQIDPVRFEQTVASGYEDEYWYEVWDIVRTAAFNSNALYAYIALPNVTHEVSYFLSVDTELNDVIFRFGYTLATEFFAPEFFPSMSAGTAGYSGVSDAGEFGLVVSGWAPILAENGHIVGMVAISLALDEVLAPVNAFVWFLAVGALLFTVVTTAVAVTIIRVRVRRPLKSLIGLVSKVSQGELSLDKSEYKFTNDDVGKLTGDMFSLVDVIRGMTDDLSSARTKYLDEGDIHYNIDESKYQNSFKEVMGQVNKILSAVTADIKQMAETMNEIGDGNFDKQLDPTAWPGEWVFVPQAVNNLSGGLKAVSTEINSMTNAVSKGNLSFRIDTKNYKGDWNGLMEGLNNIAKTVNEPLGAIEIAMRQLQMGNFDLADISKKVAAAGLRGNADLYEGVFRNIIIAFDETLLDTTSYINEISKSLALIAGGDLTQSVTRQYAGDFNAIKESLNSISNTLHKTMSGISVAADHVLSGANQISANAANLASGAQQQSGSVQELNGQIEMISRQTRRNADNASTANDLSNKSTENAGEGADAMRQMVEAMNQIKESSNNISQIVKTVQDIAFQTNLLALNASVEAARAGEHGKGFAVVADEVRTLAGRSQVAATETTALITDSISRVDSGAQIAETTTQSLAAIVESAGEVLEVISSISAASQEQQQAIEQISGGIAQIAGVTQTNTAVSEETAAASEELNAQAETLRQLVAYFKL